MWVNAFCVSAHNKKPEHAAFVEENSRHIDSDTGWPRRCPGDSSHLAAAHGRLTLLNTNDCPSAPAAIKDGQLGHGESNEAGASCFSTAADNINIWLNASFITSAANAVSHVIRQSPICITVASHLLFRIKVLLYISTQAIFGRRLTVEAKNVAYFILLQMWRKQDWVSLSMKYHSWPREL